MFKVQSSMFNVQSSMFKVQCSKFKVQCSMFKVQCSKFNVQSSKFNVQCNFLGKFALLVLDGERQFTCLLGATHHHDELSVEQLHRGLFKRFQRSSIAIADSLKAASTCDLKVQLIVSIGNQRALLIRQ